jgi:HD-GYP domain-containing protein (c-di-GMP phosphodiesterase class II)
MSKVLKKIPRGWIGVGDTLPSHIFNMNGQLLLRHGFVIETDRILSRVMERGYYLLDDNTRPITESAILREKQQIVAKEQITALSFIEDIQEKLDYLLSKIDSYSDFTSRILSLAIKLTDVVEACPDTALAWIMLPNERRYSIKHALHTAIVSYLVADRIGLSSEDKISTICAALTMNCSMMRWQDDLNEGHVKMTAIDRNKLKNHPAESVDILQKHGVQDTVWLSTVLYHHETFDGSGYPEQLKGEDIIMTAQILSITDWYTAVLVDRPDRAAKQASEFLKAIFMESGRTVDSMLVTALIKTLGIYPPGTKVKLASEEHGVVVKRGSTAQYPEVFVLIDKRGNLITPSPRNTHIPEFHITGISRDHEHKFVISRQWLWTDTVKPE